MALAGAQRQRDEGIGARAAQRRGEHADQRQLVERVGERLHVGRQIADLGALVESLAGTGHGRQTEVSDRRLVHADVGRGA